MNIELGRKGLRLTGLALVLYATVGQLQAAEPAPLLHQSQAMVPAPPWPAGDQKGMGNTQGPGTWMRCAHFLSQPGAKSYELSHIRSNTMPMSPFGTPLKDVYRPTVGIPGTLHAFNGEDTVSGEPGAQGTQMDALGHFAYLDKPWDGEGDFPAYSATYYGGFTQDQVKPTPDSPLLKLGMENAPPIVTSAVLLDAKAAIGKGQSLAPGQEVTVAHIEAMLRKQGLSERGILPGDAVYIYTGWSERWQDPAENTDYYTMGPGLSYEAAKYLEEKQVVLVALDNPFTDPVSEGQLQGKGAPPEGAPEGLPFAIHHHNLTQAGIYNIQNIRLSELAQDRVWTSCTMILPLRSKGGSGSPVRPIAVGVAH